MAGRFAADDDGGETQRLLEHHRHQQTPVGATPPLSIDAVDVRECPCRGAFDTGTPDLNGSHYAWIAYLDYDNDDPHYRKEEWLRDYYLLPVNWLTAKLSGSSYFHCQMIFWNQMQGAFVTVSVDSYRRHVFAETRKEFKCKGWIFQRITVTAQQEIAMYEFLVEQVQQRRHFNQVGAYSIWLRPTDTGGRSWFCSQLATATLQHAGYLRNVVPYSVYPGDLFTLVANSPHMTVLTTKENPIRTRRIYEQVAEVAVVAQPVHFTSAPPPITKSSTRHFNFD